MNSAEYQAQKAAADQAVRDALRKLDLIQAGAARPDNTPGIQSVGYWAAQGHWFTNY